MNKAYIKKQNREARRTFYAELIGWSLIGALSYVAVKGFYWFAVVMLSF